MLLRYLLDQVTEANQKKAQFECYIACNFWTFLVHFPL